MFNNREVVNKLHHDLFIKYYMTKPLKIMFWRIFNDTEKCSQYNFKRKKSGHKTQVPILFFKSSVSVCACRAYVFKKKEIYKMLAVFVFSTSSLLYILLNFQGFAN